MRSSSGPRHVAPDLPIIRYRERLTDRQLEVVNPIKAGWGVRVLLQSNCTHAVRLHDVPDFVKRDRRVARRADTEARLIESARRLFIADGYAATTLAAVADAAGGQPGPTR